MRPESGAVTFTVLGRAFEARGAAPRLAEWLRGAWSFPELAAPPHPHAIELSVIPAAAARAWEEPAGEEVAVTVPGFALRFRRSGRVWATGDATAGLRLELHDGHSRIQLWGDEEQGASPSLYHALYVALTEALRDSGLVPLHAAVAESGGETVAWLGASGVGKSTTLLFAVQAGWRAIAEDLCWLEPESLRVFGWDRGVHCWPETLERFFPELDGAQATSDGKRLIPYDRLGGGGPRSGVLSRLVVLGRAAGEPTRWEPAGSRDVVRSLWEATGVPLSERSRELTAACVTRLSRLPASRLVLGNAPPLPWGALGAPSDQSGTG